MKLELRVILLEIREVERARGIGCQREKPPGSFTLQKQRPNTHKAEEQNSNIEVKRRCRREMLKKINGGCNRCQN